MKTLVTYIIALLPGIKHTQAILPNRSANLTDTVSVLTSYFSAVNFSWAAIGHYVFGILKQAFKDSLLSDYEMDFLLLTIAGYWLMAKTLVVYYARMGKAAVVISNNN